MRNLVKAGIASTLFLIFFFSYGRLYELLEKWGVFVPAHAYLLPVMLFICGYCIYFICIARHDFRSTTKILNFVAVVLVLINLGNIAFYQIGKQAASENGPTQTRNNPVTDKEPATTVSRPDIYYIILDEYAHPDTMKEYYNYDNSKFIKFLEDKGFYWASESRTRTMATLKSVSSSLNMEYIDDTIQDDVAVKYIDNSRAASFLKSEGYTFIYFGSRIEIFLKNRINADISYNFFETAGSGKTMAEYSRTLWNTTMLTPFYDYLIEPTFNTSFRDGLINTLSKIKELPEIQEPKFVYAHILSPHEPFVFGPNGNYVLPENWENYKDKQYYLGQYIFITKQIEELVDSLLDESSNPPIIIIQSDHGLRPSSVHEGIEIGENEWRKIMNTYYLPGNGNEILYKNISPVNTFRLIFNRLFGTNYPMLEEK
jgi:hypothetical protein